MQNALTSSLKHPMEKPGLHVAAAWCSGSGIITGQCFASQLRSRSISVTRKEVFPHISCCLFQELGCVMGQHISLGPARRCCPYISAGMLLHALKPLLVLQHPLKSCCQGPIVKQTFFNPLLTPLAATFLAKKESVLMAAGTSLLNRGHCRQLLQTGAFPCRQLLRLEKKHFLWGADGLLAVPGALQKEPNIINPAQCEQPYTSRKGQTDQIVFPFSTIF